MLSSLAQIRAGRLCELRWGHRLASEDQGRLDHHGGVPHCHRPDAWAEADVLDVGTAECC